MQWFVRIGTRPLRRLHGQSELGHILLIRNRSLQGVDKWYNLPTAKTENIWESFAEIEYDKGYFPNEEDKKAISGKVKFTKFKQEGKLSYTGEGYCIIKGEFEITLENKKPSENAIEIKKGKFYVPKSRYWDSRAMED